LKYIKIKTLNQAGIIASFDNVTDILVDDTSLGSGGFGTIYHLTDVKGGICPPVKFVIKIFHSDDEAKENHGWRTINRLLDIVREENINKQKEGKYFLIDHPSLLALPVFTFEGTMEGKRVRGYSMLDLHALGFVGFDKIIGDTADDALLEQIDGMDMEWKYEACYHLARGFNWLYKKRFLHADVSPDNIFIHTKYPLAVIIDYDSGAIIDTLNDNPSTFGKPQLWLAPEITFQMKKMNESKAKEKNMIDVNIYSDLWSVAHCITQLLITLPAFYLTDLSENSLRSYVSKHVWPQIDVNDPLFMKENEYAYEVMMERVSDLPSSIQKALSVSFTKGVFHPSSRTTYSRWESTFKALMNDSRKDYWDDLDAKFIEQLKMNVNEADNYDEEREELSNYISMLVVDLVNGDETIEANRNYIIQRAKRAHMDSKEVITELEDFLDFFHLCTDKKNTISKFERNTIMMQGECALVSHDTLEQILRPYKVK